MATLPIYDPGGTQRTQAQRQNAVSPDAFGAAQGRALESVGRSLQPVVSMLDEKARENDTADVMDAYTQASSRLRSAMYDPDGGVMNRTGSNARGIAGDVDRTSETIFNEVSANLKTEEQRRAFAQMWGRKQESALDTAAGYEFKQAAAARQEAKSSALGNLQSDVVANYASPEALAANFDAARAMIRANPDGLSPEGVAKMEREGISALHVSVIQRMAQDDPGAALDYYEKNKAQVNGADHATANNIIKQVSGVRSAKTATQEIVGTGPAMTIYRAIEGAESGGDPNAEGFRANAGGQRAQGLMQLMPDTAREVAIGLGMREVAAMSDEELGAFWATPKGQAANRAIGATYLNQQLTKFGGDFEAAIIAYNAGPANAEKFLNAGRDYAALPKAEETYSYVGKVMGQYFGVDMSGRKLEDGSAGFQQAMRGGRSAPGARYVGDAREFLLKRLQPGHDASHIDEMQPVMRDALAAMFSDAPDYVKDGLDILSGTRTVERQAELFAAEVARQGGDVAAARKNVAPPGKSRHNHGDAADLGWKGSRFAAAPKEVRDWVHANAARYGLTFPMGHEPWHIETVGARKGDRPTKDDVIQNRIEQAHEGTEPTGEVRYTGAAPSAADIYTQSVGVFTIPQEQGNLSDWLDAARERYSDNPPLLAEVERQLTDEYNSQKNAKETETAAMTREVFARIMQGGSVQTEDPALLQRIGPEGVSKLITLEGKFTKNQASETDNETYYKLSQMSPEELRNVNLIDYADKLSRQDFQKWADRQAAASRPATREAASAGMRTRTQLVASTVDTLGLNPKPGSDDAIKVAMLDRALDERIAQYIANNPDKTPDAVEIQKMLDGLVIEGRTTENYLLPDTRKMAFELTPEERATFAPADNINDIPEATRPVVARGYFNVYGFEPNETGATEFYNDMARVALGAAPEPPKELVAQIKQMFAQRYGRVPTLEEQSTIYMKLIQKATGAK